MPLLIKSGEHYKERESIARNDGHDEQGGP